MIVIDRDIKVEDKSLYTAYIGSDFRKEGEKAVTMAGESAGKTGENGRARPDRPHSGNDRLLRADRPDRRAGAGDHAQHPNWNMVAQECGDFTRAKAYEVMGAILKQTKDIDVVYCENDGEALGAIDAMEEAGLTLQRGRRRDRHLVRRDKARA